MRAKITAIRAGIAYAVSVFIAGFALGTLRVKSTFLAQYGTPSGLIGLAAQIVFALFPLLQAWRPR
jgi:hypothetical protein